ncbi:O-antigen ligase-like membrane protein [Paenibacillus taihuensis]|uniref:O-antigen ligase-like membrane protein n=1 Tax=Paenibacillus taihuensis TaxID=1156355 RepID=A0A3D9SKI7_9BACL|nr:O-antigen ligase family protein [Paenibacillus taihuensis]REE90512.1 O-antigen ligase-like membrane protein [Paenibacillus taihuensis]
MNLSKKALQVQASDVSLIKWLGLTVIAIFLFAFPYCQGLFNGYKVHYEGPLLEAELLVFALLLFSCIYLFKVWTPNSWKAILAACIWLLPITYLISSLHPASEHMAQFMTYINFMLASLFVLSLYLTDSAKARTYLLYSLLLSGYGVVLYGLANMMGQVYFPDALWYQQEVYRVTSVFQYPNAYAAYLSSLFLVCIYLITEFRNWYWRFANGLMLVPIWISFMLTLSRGALVIVPLLILIILPFLKLKNQILYLNYIAISIVFSFAILGKISVLLDKIGRAILPDSSHAEPRLLSPWADLPLSGWTWLVLASVICSAAISIVHRYVEPLLERKLSSFSMTKWSYTVIPLALIIVTIAGSVLVLGSSAVRQLLPGEISNRIETINFNQHSVLERKTFYADALKLSADYPVFGAGGGAWAALYEKYQNNPYVSKQAHSYYFSTLVETGWVGLLVLLGLLTLMFFIYIRHFFRDRSVRKDHLSFFIFAVSLLIHSIIDFDMSYVYLSALVFISLGAMVAAYNTTFQKVGWAEFANKAWRYVYPTAIALLAIVLLTWSFREYKANNLYQQALMLAADKNNKLKDYLPELDSAISASPNHPDYMLRKVDWMSQAYAQTNDEQYKKVIESLLKQLKNTEPNNRDVILAEYQFTKAIQKNVPEAIGFLEEGITKFQWDIHYYEALIMEYFTAGQSGIQVNGMSTEQEWNKALELYNQVLKRKEALTALPKEQLQGRAFDLTPMIRFAVGQIYYSYHDYGEAVSLLRPLAQGKLNEPFVKISTPLYLDSLDAIGKSDKKVYNQLIDADPSQKETLSALKTSRSAKS